MKLLILQPKFEKEMLQLEQALRNNPEADAVAFPEGYLNENADQARKLARQHRTMLIGGYRRMHERPKDRALLIGRNGEILLDRTKYTDTAFVSVEGVRIGHVLCDEIVLQGVKGETAGPIDLIVHPIGVGMFSEEQYAEWVGIAQRLAAAHRATIVGASHADGCFRDSETSIPIAYAVGPDGQALFAAKNDTRPRLLDTETGEVTIG